MFTRSKTMRGRDVSVPAPTNYHEHEGEPDQRPDVPPSAYQAGSPGPLSDDPVPAPKIDPGHSLDQMLDRLQETVGPGSDAGSGTAMADSAAEHADLLRFTRGAQQDAQDILAMATQTRTVASEQAEQIVREAHDSARRLTEDAEQHADRVRREIAEWAAEQRIQVQSAVAELSASASREADELHEDAKRSALVEADRAAKAYVGEVVARGTRDAEAIRANARDLLDRCTHIVNEASVSVQELAATTAGLMTTLRNQAESIDRLLAEVGGQTDVAPTAEALQAEASRPLGSLFRVPDPAPSEPAPLQAVGETQPGL